MICFVIALESEAKPVIANMSNVQSAVIYGRKVYTGEMNDENTCVIVTDVGKVNAAAGTQLAIERFGAEAVINLGLAGGLNQSMHVGEIYAISHAAEYDFDLCQINGTSAGTLNECEQPWLPLHCSEGYACKKLGTGDRFNDSRQDFILLTEQLGADIRDMEGGAVAHVCMRAGVPCFSFKCISDIAGAGSTTEQFISNTRLCAENLRAGLPEIFAAVRRAIR